MTKQKEAATPTATATQATNTTKLVNSSEKSKFSYINLLDKIMEMGFDVESDCLTEKIKRDVRIAEAHTTLPIDCFPSRLQKIAKQFAGEQRTCTNYVLTNMLVVAGAAAGTNANIVNQGYENFPVLFACLVGTPSAGKTPSMRSVLKPLEAIDTEANNHFRAKYAEWKKAKNTTIPQPRCEHIILKDTTPEGIIKVHDQNRRGVLIHADEAVRFFKNIDKYSGGDFISSLRESWAGDSIKVTRKTEDIPVSIEHPFISFLCGIQPGKLKEIFGQYIDDGFIQRFMFVCSNPPESRTALNESTHAEWENIIHTLRRITPTTMIFDNEATLFLNKFDDKIREMAKCCEDAGKDTFSEWLLKQNYVIHRLSGILHLLDGDNMNVLIDVATVKKALRLTISYGYHFLRFLETIQERKQPKKMTKGEALRTVIREFKIFEDLPKRKKYTPNSFAKVLGISQPTLWQHLNEKER